MSRATATTPALSLVFRAIHEPNPGPKLRAVFDEYWPGYHAWMRKHPTGWPTIRECRRELAAHMPELVRIYDEILALAPTDNHRARFLSLYRPTPIIRACSQAVINSSRGPLLIRNYDHAPHLCDAVVLSSEWGGAKTHVMTDCLWGALDGVNDAGLIVALAFGGRRAVGPGFSASLIVRYLLQTCTTVRQACDALRRVPVYMPYNFTMLDRSGEYLTAFSSPDRPLAIDHGPVSTNHQGEIDWPEYASFCQSAERRARLTELTAPTDPNTDPAPIINAFLEPPLFRTQYRRASGTLYTVAYSPHDMAMSLYWRSTQARIDGSESPDRSIQVTY